MRGDHEDDSGLLPSPPSEGKEEQRQARKGVDIDLRQFNLVELAEGEARIRAIVAERFELTREKERLEAEKLAAEAAHAIAEVKRELDEVIHHLNVELDEVNVQLGAIQTEQDTIERKAEGDLTQEEGEGILRLEDLSVPEPSTAALFLQNGGAVAQTYKGSVAARAERRRSRIGPKKPATAVESDTLVVPGDGAGAGLMLGHGVSEHSMHVSASVDPHGAGAEVEIELSIDEFNGERRLYGMPERLQLAGSVVTVGAKSSKPGAALGVFDAGRVKMTLAHCHAGPAARLCILHEATAVASDNIEDTLMEHEWTDLRWSEYIRGRALIDGCETGFVTFIAPRPGRYVVARRMVDPKAQRRGAQADLDRVYLLPTPRHSGGKMNAFEALSFALSAFPAQKSLVDGLVETAGVGDLSTQWPIAEDGGEDSAGAAAAAAAAAVAFGVSGVGVGGPFLVCRGQPVTVEMVLPERPDTAQRAEDEAAAAGDSSPGRDSKASGRRSKSPTMQRSKSPARRRSPMRSARSALGSARSALSSARSSINSARSNLSSRASPLRRSPGRRSPSPPPEPEPEPEPVLDPAELPPAASLYPMTVTDVDWRGQPGAILKLALRCEADEATIRDSLRMPFQLSLTFNIPKVDVDALSLSAVLDKKSELDLKHQEQAMILQAAVEEEVIAEPASCMLRFVGDGRPWPKMFAGDCLAVHLGELKADETGHAQAEAAAEANAEHAAATKLQKVWRGRVGRQAQLKALFKQYDYDGSGTLEREEVASLLRKLGAVNEMANIDLTMARMCGMESLAEDVAMGMAIPSVTTDEFELWFKQRTVAQKKEEHEEQLFGEIHAQQMAAAKAQAAAKAKEGKVAWHEPLKMLMMVVRYARDWRKKKREQDYVVELPGAAKALERERAGEKLQP